MIKGIGTDIVKIERIGAIISRSGDRLAQRILSKNEFEQYLICSDRPSWLAKRFVAKEAAAKALGTGFRQGLRFEYLQITNDHLGKPEIEFLQQGSKLANEMGITHTHLSLADEKDFAVAFVVFEG